MGNLADAYIPAKSERSEVPAPCLPRESYLDFLRERRLLSALNLERVRRVHTETGESLPAILLKTGLVSEEDLSSTMGEWAGLECRAGEVAPVDYASLNGLNAAFFRTHEIVPVEFNDEELVIACWDALDDFPVRALQFAAGLPIRRLVMKRADVLAVLKTSEFEEADSPSDDQQPADSDEEQIERIRDLAGEEPVIRLVQRLINDAVLRHASDIHLEPTATELQVRYRTDGLLQLVETHPKSWSAPIISRIKVLAGLNIAERRLPQDGRIRVTIRGAEVDFRVATSPTLHGESVVLRILDRQDRSLDFQSLGFDADLLDTLADSLSRPYGIILVTGPTGSGKTTTLYAALDTLNTQERKILTVEDPVEYTLEGINQVPIRPEIGLTFAGALRSFLRQDPDVLMVGEIRDRETAEIAVQAALTGHLLLSTLHTNSAAAAITRLLDMGLDDYLLTSTLQLILGQRLVRKLCDRCREPYEPTADVRRRFDMIGNHAQLYRPKGCPFCQHTGWSGRTAIIEALSLTDGLRTEILARSDAHRIEARAVRDGMRTLLKHGMERAAAGETTIEEVLRITDSR